MANLNHLSIQYPTLKYKNSQTFQEQVIDLQQAFESSQEGIVIFSDQDTLTAVNPAFIKMTGFKSDNVLGLSSEQFDAALDEISNHKITAIINPEKITYFWNRLLIDQKEHREKNKLLNDDSIEKPLDDMLIVSRFEIKNQSKIVYFKDITCQYQKERINFEFMPKLAHELRTPLASIQGFSELLLSQKYEPEIFNELLQIIYNQSIHLEDSIKKAVELIRVEGATVSDFCFETQAIWPIIESAINKRSDSNQGRSIHVNSIDFNYQVNADFKQLSRAISYVLDNAYKFSDVDDEISIFSKEFYGENNQQMIGIAIVDTGIGMTSKDVEKVFDRFWRADSAKNSVGLGLAIAKEIMILHEGLITVESQAGQGTEVCLWLPVLTKSSSVAYG